MIESREDVKFPILAGLAQSGDEGRFAELTSSYIQWMASRRDEIIAEHVRLTAEIRGGLGDFPGVHPRHPNAAAELLAAYKVFLGKFAVEKGLIVETDAEGTLSLARKILVELVKAQAEIQEATKPGRKFCEFLGAALRSGQVFLRNKRDSDAPPEFPESCGWEKHYLFLGTDRAFRGEPQVPTYQKPKNRRCVGCVDDEEKMIYLDKTVAILEVNEWARKNGDANVFTAASLGRDLIHEGECVPIQEGDKKRASSNRTIGGTKGHFYRIPRDKIMPLDQIVPSEKS